MSASQSDLQRTLNEFRAIQVELMRMKSMSPRAMYTEAVLMDQGKAPEGSISPTPITVSTAATDYISTGTASAAVSSGAAVPGLEATAASASWSATPSLVRTPAASAVVNEVVLNHKLYVILKNTTAS